MRRFFRRWPAQFQRGIFAYLFKPFLDLAFLIKQPPNPSDQFSNIPIFHYSSLPVFHCPIIPIFHFSCIPFFLRLCRSVSPVVSESAEWKKIGEKGKTSSTFSLAEKRD